jgi:serine/threonine-protein kinase RsbW
MATASPRPDAPPPPALVPGLRWRRVFPGEERQLAPLRRWLAELLPPCTTRDDVTAVATELASNAIRHTRSGHGGWFAVETTWNPQTVRIAVADCGGPSEPHVVDDPAAEHGRGLLVVRGLSARTGAAGDHRGRLVWADIAWPEQDPQPSVLGHDPYEAAIREGQAALATRFAGVPAWFGRSTLQWWALPSSGELVTAPTARELAKLLSRKAHGRPPSSPGADCTATGAIPARGADRRGQAAAPPPPAPLTSRPAGKRRSDAWPGQQNGRRKPAGPGTLRPRQAGALPITAVSGAR